MAALGEMSSGIAHEINNPLAIISGKASHIRRTAEGLAPPNEVLIKDADTINRMIERTSKIINGLKAFARDGERDPFVFESLDTIVQDTLALCQSKFANHEIEVKYEPLEKSLVLECRPIQISQVLLNLLGNAADAIERLPTKWIRIETSELGDWIEMRVIDSGAGIEPSLREKIVMPFFTTKEVGKGTGLGLSISSGIIKNHGGSLTVDPSCVNTCFTIKIPKKQSQAA